MCRSMLSDYALEGSEPYSKYAAGPKIRITNPMLADGYAMISCFRPRRKQKPL